jgi:hypothetical protein
MSGISVIIPVDKPRLDLLNKSLNKYFEFNFPRNVEFLLVTRSITADMLVLGDCIRIIPYTWNASTFSQGMALNLGVRAAKYDSIIVTSPEVMPSTDVLNQLVPYMGRNVVCQVFDCNPNGSIIMPLVNSNYRSDTPSMHFLALFNRKDILFINGWDEDFMLGQAYDDDDFGWRFKQAGLPFEFADHIQALHQFHERHSNHILWRQDESRFHLHQESKIVQVKNGIFKLVRDNEDTSTMYS